jgi:putative sterol carrier protein
MLALGLDGIDAAAVDPVQFANLIHAASDDQLEEYLTAARELIIGEIFRRMEQHFDPSRAAGIEGVIDWRITGRGDRGCDHFQVIIAKGRCKIERDGAKKPRTTLHAHAISFVRLATGNAAGVRLFLSGALRIEGDKRFALKAQSCFRIPKPSPVG